jgi:hypothetical protein
MLYFTAPQPTFLGAIWVVALVAAVAWSAPVIASSPPNLYIRPYVDPFLTPGQEVTVDIREDSGATPVDGVQATVTYPTDKLELRNVNNEGSPFSVTVDQDVARGNVRLARGRVGVPLVGSQHIVNMTFAGRAPGVAMIDFAPGSRLISSAHKTSISPALDGFPVTIQALPVRAVAPVANSVLGASTVLPSATVYATPSKYVAVAAPDSDTTLPATGTMGGVAGTLGLGAMGAASVAYLRSRRGLKQRQRRK